VSDALTVALVHEVFHGADGVERLNDILGRCRDAGAELVLLPELPLDPWIPASETPRPEDAERPGGPRHQALSGAAKRSGLFVMGGAITLDDESGERFNRALLFDPAGQQVAAYDKLHVPCEEGFWEAKHYRSGATAATPVEVAGFSVGLQICSDLNRPAGSQLLGAAGAEAIVAPRATPESSYERWRLVIRANAVTCATYVLSVNRPRSEGGASIGGPSLAVGPDGTVLLESTEPVSTVVLRREAVAQARRDYPGYLEIRAELYGRAWSELARRTKE
jgi:predicted amidohydrolase